MARTTLSQRAADLRVAADAAEGRIADEVIAAARLALQRAGERSQLSAEHTVVALAGATGTGKSTLFNLLTGADLARTSQQRPTTAFPLAAIAESSDIAAGSAALLDWLGVKERHELDVSSRHPEGLVLLDLPDHDSVVTEHRVRADHVTERADLLVWVTNPQKYADAVLHSRYLIPLAGHEDSVVVVLNQLDRLTHEDAAACLADLTRLVEADGLRARILGASAHSGEGVPQLEALIARAVDRREASTARLTADVRHAASELLAALPGTAPDARALADARRRLVDALEHAAGIPLVVDAVRDSSLRDGFARTGWPPTRWVRALRADPLRTLGLRPPERRREVDAPADSELIRSSLPTASPAVRAQVATATRTYVAAAAAALPGGAQERVNARAVAASAGIVDSVDRAIVRTVEVRSARWWGVANVMQWLLLAVAIAGGAWLGLLALLDYLRMPTEGLVPMLAVGEFDVPWPTLLLVAGAALGLMLAVASAFAVRAGARRRAARVAGRLRDGIAAVAHDEILDEVDAELTALTTAREAARRAAR
ncbi:GTPase [Microbacterium sp. ProA8]|jgi:GTP-binding protein EngB required for normal cell division|uniref:GTPase family protein n=1 Tax=Microbacterium chionoecetis TaxID=3153754 RepID=UPI003267C4F5